jgi:ADP-ribosyl-[dinitrogen reductase] hydrolase
MPTTSAEDRAVGCLLGLAVGDALGTTLEFAPRDRAQVADMVGGGPFGLEAGQWTDDTAMALCLADALLAEPQIDPADLQDRFLAWVQDGAYSATGTCFDIGQTTLSAINRYRRGHGALAGDTSPTSAGNGSIMRLAPVAVRWWSAPDAAERVADLQGRTTHAAPACRDACALLTRVLNAAIAGQPAHTALFPEPDPAWCPAIQAIARGDWANRVVHTLEAGLWAAYTTDTFHDAVLRAANLGDDADTVAAVAGQIAGALYGASAIPQDWRTTLAQAERLADRAHRLYAASPDLAHTGRS